jgi:LPS-assembly protein
METCRAAVLVAFFLLLAASGVAAQTPLTVPTPGGEVTVIADRLEQLGAENIIIATGNVELTRGNARLTADRVELNRETGDAVALGRAVFYDAEDRLTGDRIDYNWKTGTGVVYNGEARTAPYYRIAGERMERLGEGLYRLRRGVFTTCEDDPPAWSFHTASGQANLDSLVYGTNASFWVRNIPLLPYFPFFAAAIRRERQTGFLFPRLGSTSRKGNFIEQPFYWAISDSQDATFTLDLYEKVGVGASVDYRYLLSRTNYGDWHGFYIRETEKLNADRGWYRLRHDWLIAPRLTFKVDVNGVSDDQLFRDWADRLHDRSLQRAESNVFVTKSWDNWNLVGNMFWYQDLTQSRPVELRRLPEITLHGVRQPVPGLPGFLYQLDSSFVNFVREVGSQGVRVDLHPRLSRPIPAAGYFTVTPFVGGRLTGYDKTVTGTRLTQDGGIPVEVTSEEVRIRQLAELGADFETRASRIYNVGGLGNVDAILHSIEPRVNYTYIFGDNRDQLPIYQESIDRIPEQSAFTYSLVNRIRARTVAPEGTEPTRWEAVRFTVGHSYDFKNKPAPIGNVNADLLVNPNRIFVFRGDTSYNFYGDGFQRSTMDVSVNVPRVTATVGWRFERHVADFLQGSVTAELTRFLVARATTNWDLKTDTFVENRVGFDLRYQCWALSVEYVSRNKHEDSVVFTVNLLGVGAPLSTSAGLGALGGGLGGGGTTR